MKLVLVGTVLAKIRPFANFTKLITTNNSVVKVLTETSYKNKFLKISTQELPLAKCEHS